MRAVRFPKLDDSDAVCLNSVFRREPLLKVSMNMRLQPTVRAAFVPEENVLKLILKETIEVSATETKQEVVIYAVKVRLYQFNFMWSGPDATLFPR